MKNYFPLMILSLLFCSRLSAQNKDLGQIKDSLEGLPGLYRMSVDSAQKFRIRRDKDQLILEVIGQGQTELIALGSGKFSPRQVSPPATLDFIRDSLGKVYKFTWFQDRKGEGTELIRVAASSPENKGGYPGLYKVKNNPYRTMRVLEENNRLKIQVNDGEKIEIAPLSADKFIFKKGGYTVRYSFIRDKKGNIQKLMSSVDGLLDFIKEVDAQATAASPDPVSSRRNGFTHADSLRGMLTPLRTCYDVLFYGLDLRVLPETRSIQGNTTIRFRALESFDKIQLDLYANMKIGKILFHERELSYTREFNAVFIQFPAYIKKGEKDAITVFYSGQPQQPDPATLKGGIFWYHDQNGAYWIESVCQGSGASLWWPCKDHLSDKPDSMKISITVPTGLKDISNGRLVGTTTLPGDLTRFDWYVSYPINNYNVVINIGNYAHFSDSYIRQRDTLTLDYYCMPYNLEKARRIFKQVRPMLALYEKDFGGYPFSRDGFTLMESLYPMDHQGAVSIGSINYPIDSDQSDLAELGRLTWHESAHEWWGNSVTCKDMADFWIHEAFATYAEVLACETFSGRPAALKYLKDQHPDNKEPLIGVYDVNDFHMGDIYSKGCLMLNTLRNVINNDSVWFSLLRGIQGHFRYQTVTTEDLVGYINQATKKDYTPFFDQYLRHAAIPELSLTMREDGDGLALQYKWNAGVKGFDMPVKITTAKNSFAFIYPTSDWQTINLKNMKPADFNVDTDDFYIGFLFN